MKASGNYANESERSERSERRFAKSDSQDGSEDKPVGYPVSKKIK